VGALVRAVPDGCSGNRGIGEGNGRASAHRKLNVDENPATAARFGVQSIPTLLVLDRGREIDRIIGAQPKAAIVQRLEQALRT
jgi:thioredoxin-like negative regulator of GroEL